MVYVKKKQVLFFSNGSVVTSKTPIKTLQKIKSLDKDHLTLLFNRKCETLNEDSLNNLKKYKSRFFRM